jgi:hypothetical protein
MKTKTLLLVCLFLGIGLTQLSAQWPQPANGKTGAVSFYEEWDGYWCPVYIDGVLVDELVGTVNMHNVPFVKNGVPIKATQHMYGDIQSIHAPYEVFKVSDMSHGYYSSEILAYRVNLIGNYGTHYICYFLYNMVTGETTPVKTMVLGKNK